jgi:hypothetical protein
VLVLPLGRLEAVSQIRRGAAVFHYDFKLFYITMIFIVTSICITT